MLDYKASFFDLLRTPNMRMKSLSIFFNWIVCGMGLFGMSQYISQVGGDIFINFAVSGAIQIPGNFVAWWAMNTLGRRITLICSNSISGVACLFLIIVSNSKKSYYMKTIYVVFFLFMLCFFFTPSPVL